MTERLTLHAAGRPFVADLALPADPQAAASAPGLVVIHEWWGLVDGIRSLAERFAAEGFVVLAPDLYGGATTTDATEAFALMDAMRTEDAVEIVRACVAALRSGAIPGSRPQDAEGAARKVGVTGFCMGGAMAFAAAASVEGLSAAAPFYGSAKKEYMDADRVVCPIQAHFAKNDPWIDPAPATALAEAMHARGGAMELFVYDAPHAFMREGDPETYDAAAAALAWSRVIPFFRDALR